MSTTDAVLWYVDVAEDLYMTMDILFHILRKVGCRLVFDPFGIV